MFNDKKVLFIGPIGNPTKEFVDRFDYVIRTNNYFGMDRSKLNCKRCDILLANCFYSKNHYETIIQNFYKVKYIITKSTSYDFLREKLIAKFGHFLVDQKLISMPSATPHILSYTKNAPLLGMHFLEYIELNYKPKKLFFSGTDFYKSSINKIPSKYLVNYRPGRPLEGSHNVPGNIKYFKDSLNKYKWLNCEEYIKSLIK